MFHAPLFIKLLIHNYKFKEIIPNITKYLNNSISEEPIDGNSFTDYIHYYSLNNYLKTYILQYHLSIKS